MTTKSATNGGNVFAQYDAHYQAMGNTVPDWDGAERRAAAFACRKPWLPSNRDARVLDFGCGWGGHLLALWCAGYRNVEGVEISPEQAAAARAAAGGRVPIAQGDGREYLDGRDGRYDVIILNDVIEHVAPPECLPLLRRVYRALRPAGRIVVRTPNMASLLAAYSRYIDVTHVTGFTEPGLVQVLTLAGFTRPRFVSDYQIDWRAWRPWSPLKHTGVSTFLNRLVHHALYTLRMQAPRPTRFGYNLEVYAERSASEPTTPASTLSSEVRPGSAPARARG